MYIATVPNRNSPPAILLRESYREKGKVKTRTLSNLSRLPKSVIDLISRSLKGEKFVSADERFEKVDSWHHGHVDAVLRAMKRLGFDRLISARRCKERDLAIAMVVGRILEPDNEQNSKLANTRWWKITTLPSTLDLDGVDEDDLYEAMDWLLARQDVIEKKLAKRHLTAGGVVLYDLTSSYFEGITCPLAALGHDRDGKKGKLQVNYGLLTDDRGCPIAVSVFPGNTLDHQTLMSQTEKMRDQFGIQTMVVVGDRGMITQKLIDTELRGIPGVDWITALKSGAIQKLVNDNQIQLSLFDEINLCEITTDEYPGERLIVCRNPDLAKQRTRKRQALLDATAEKLMEVRSIVENGKLRGKDNIARRLDNTVKKYKVAKQFTFTVRDDGFDVHLDDKQAASDAALDAALRELRSVRSLLERGKLHGASEIRKRVNKVIIKYNLVEHAAVDIDQADFDIRIKDKAVAGAAALDPEDTVRSYKSLSQVERAFRSIKTVDLKVRPIRHRLAKRVRAHIFLCMLAYYVEWHMREVWRPLLFVDEDQEIKKTGNPVAPAKRSAAALRKARSKCLDDGTEVHSFQTLLKLMSQIVRSECRVKGSGPDAPIFEIVTTPSKKQKQAYDLLKAIAV
jgi:transposase